MEDHPKLQSSVVLYSPGDFDNTLLDQKNRFFLLNIFLYLQAAQLTAINPEHKTEQPIIARV